MPMCTPNSWATWRMAMMRSAWSSWSPWEKLSRKVVAPASISWRSTCLDSVAGPIVATILVRRIGSTVAMGVHYQWRKLPS